MTDNNMKGGGEYMTEKIDYSILKDGFELTYNRFTGYYFVKSVQCNEDGDYQFCTKDFKDTAERLCTFLNLLLEDNRRLCAENQRYKNIICEAVKSERTDLGSSVLRNLAANLGLKV